jgi:hypothetical protein
MISITQEFETEGQARVALSFNSYFGVLWDFDQELRNQMKHTDLSDDEYDKVSELRTKLNSLMDIHSVSFEDVL